MKIEQVAPVDLVPAEYNPRTIEPEQLSALVKSINRWGFVEPVVVNDTTGNIVGGHQRVAAAIEIGLATVPVVRVSVDASNEQALNIALNKISGEWDIDALVALLADLRGGGFDLIDLGFTDAELGALNRGAFEDMKLIDGWDEPADLSGVADYNPDEATATIRIRVPVDEAPAVTMAVKTMATEAGWSFEFKS